MFNSLKKKLNAAVEALNRLDWVTIADVQVCLRSIRESLIAAQIEDRDIERFIHRALDSFAGRDIMAGSEAARMVYQDLRAALSHLHGIDAVFSRRSEGEAQGQWCLKEFDKLVREPLHGRRYRQPMMERRIFGPVRLRGMHATCADLGQWDDRHTGPIDRCAINRMIASLRGNDEPGQEPPDIGNPALI